MNETKNKQSDVNSELVSIVIPAFNVEQYISRCLDSITNQTHKNIEIIIVNDASTDNTRNIVEKYTQEDKRIICIDKLENRGSLQARMTGIAEAKGKYIYSVDSDDYVMPNLVKDTLKEALKHNAEIVQFPMKLTSKEKKYTHNWTRKKYQEYDKNDFFLQNGNTWTIMFKKELGDVLGKYIGSLSLSYHDDYIISIILSSFYKKVRYIDTAYYIYCDTNTSMTRQYSDDALVKYMRDTLIFTRFMKELMPKIFPEKNSDYLFTVVSNRMRLMQDQLNNYFTGCKEINIYDLYKGTNENKTFIHYAMLYDVMQIKNHQLAKKEQQVKYQKQALQQKDQQLKQEQSHINSLQNNRWYRFGKLSRKRKIWTIAKVVSKKIKLYWVLQPIAKLLKEILGK